VFRLSPFLFVAIGLPARSKSEQERYNRLVNIRENDNESENAIARPDPRLVFRALCRIPVLRWLIQVAVMGAGMSLVDSFLFVMLQNELGASTRLCGYTVGITVLMELPIFHYSKWLLKHWGHDVLFAVAMLSYVIRVLGYTVLTESTVLWVLLLEVLHGLTSACMWIAAIDFSAAVAPAEWSTTVQTIMTMTMQCLGGGVGPLIGGYVYDKYGAFSMYRGAGYVVGCVLVIHLATFGLCRQGHDAFLRRQAAKGRSSMTDGSTQGDQGSRRSVEIEARSEATTRKIEI
jgi:MFS family permease